MARQRRQQASGLNQVIVKFREGGQIDENNDGTLYAKPYSLDAFFGVLDQSKGARVRRSYSLSSREMEEFQNSLQGPLGQEFPSLNLFVRVIPPPGTDLRSLAKMLRKVDEVESVSLAGPLRPAQSGTNLDFSANQGYLLPATDDGIDAEYAWSVPGGSGCNVVVCDLEFGFNPDHVDLPTVTVIYNDDNDLSQYTNHGTKTLGVLAAPLGAVDGILGIKGICHQARMEFGSISATDTLDPDDDNAGDAIQAAIDSLGAGDVLLLELQAPVDDETWAPVEWRTDLRPLIAMAVGKDITVVQAAGNGGSDLAGFQTTGGEYPFDPDRPSEYVDTKSIIVGSGWAPGHPLHKPRTRRSDSNYGARVDCQGWGNGVATTGDSLIHNGGADKSWTWFDGTSSAAAIVAGAVACVQSAAQDVLSTGYLEPEDVRDLFRDADNGSYQPGNEPADRVNGEPQPGSDAATNWIGSLPDLRKILTAAAVQSDFFLRDHRDDSGRADLAELRCLGPDIIPTVHEVVAPDTDLGPPHWDDRDVGVNMALGEQRFLYVRGRNRGGVPAQGDIDLYWSRPSTYLHPALWHPIDTIPFTQPLDSSHLVLGPVSWNPVAARPEGPAVLISVVRASLNPADVPGVDASTEEYLDFLHHHNDIRFRSVWDVAVVPDVWTSPFRMELRGLRDRSGVFRFEVSSRVPSGTTVELTLTDGGPSYRRRFVSPLVSGTLQHVFRSNRPLVIDSIGLPTEARIPVDVRFRVPGGTWFRGCSVSLDQFWGRRQLGRLNLRLRGAARG